ncbi:hypothetical protein K438DRAFT_1981470 [Mycena galopus ATCC 62051]|nr:hypothetical protein K438DRAFT_1981470 [Mycena galopus ATCC 62051]
MPSIICLHRIGIKLLNHPHRDFPPDMQIFAQVIVKKHIILQTMSADPDPISWELKLDSKIPDHAAAFLLAVMRHSKTQGTRLLGYLEIQ